MHVLLRINRTKNSQNHQGPLTKSPENFLFSLTCLCLVSNRNASRLVLITGEE